jgi:Kef-type K+ transport system membrane component KefB
MARVLEIVMIIVVIFLILGVVTLPWPANLILGGLATTSFIIAIISDRQKKKKQNKEQIDNSNK